MKIFYDTEFLEDGKTIDLISIGMVDEDGNELYLVNESIGKKPLYDRICKHKWLMENVVPQLPLDFSFDKPSGHSNDPDYWFFYLNYTDNRIVQTRYIRNAVRDFVLKHQDPELWAWYGAYDHVALCQLFGSMTTLPPRFPKFTNDLRQEVTGGPRLPEQTSANHNALEDAKWVKSSYLWLQENYDDKSRGTTEAIQDR